MKVALYARESSDDTQKAPPISEQVKAGNAWAEIRVLAGDGKLRFLIDWSKRTFPEAEWLHPSLGEDDARRYAGFLHDLVEEESLPLSDLSQAVVKLQVAIAFLAEQQGRAEQALGISAQQQAITITSLNVLLDALKPGQAGPTEPEPPKDKRLDEYIG